MAALQPSESFSTLDKSGVFAYIGSAKEFLLETKNGR